MILLIKKIVASHDSVVVVQFMFDKVGKIHLIGEWYTVAPAIYITTIASCHICAIYPYYHSIGLSGFLTLFAMLSTVCGKGKFCLFMGLGLVSLDWFECVVLWVVKGEIGSILIDI